eukprot:1327334-Lingulodinium_polyedra.AAC.1
MRGGAALECVPERIPPPRISAECALRANTAAVALVVVALLVALVVVALVVVALVALVALVRAA